MPGYPLVSRAVGLLLLAAAGLKLHGLAVEPVGRLGFFAAPEVQSGLLGLEALLGIWLISGKRPIGAWSVSLLGFLAFATASFYQAWIGQASCGCFGALRVHPWYTFSLDVFLLLLLALGRPDLTSVWEKPATLWTQGLLPLACGLAGVATILGGLAGFAYLAFGSTEAALAYARGEAVSIFPGVMDLGEAQPGQVIQGEVQVRNWTENTVRLIGGTSDCSCDLTEDLPASLGPGESKSIRVKMRLPASSGIVTRKAFFRTDALGNPALVFMITARSTPIGAKALDFSKGD